MKAGIRYDEESAVLREEARRWLGSRCTIADARAEVAGAEGSEEKRFAEIAALGWLGLTTPVEYGGAGMGAVALATLLEESGRALLPASLLPQTLAGLCIRAGGTAEQRARWLPPLASGQARAALALTNADGDFEVGRSAVVRERRRLSGEKHHALRAADADWLVVPFVEEDRSHFAVVDARAEGVEVEPEITLDRTRSSARIRLRNVAVEDDAVLARDGEATMEELRAWACTALAAEMAGGADALLVMTSAYAATRQQFGKPIGSFQAVKHPLVNVLVEVEKTRSLVYGAATALDEANPAAPRFARMAKAQASDTYVFAASRAIQLHGGYGFTEDCDAHLYLKRAQVMRPFFGDAAHHRRVIGEELRAQATANEG